MAQTTVYTARETMHVVIVGHVDHGKSTVIGRLMADTGALPEGKLAAVQEQCRRNARPFEYAFLLDALKHEQAQGITIDAARCFFKTQRRDYIINDAPGHVEFLKNMITGAARARVALLVIDAQEGIQENSKRHGYILSMLGIRQVAVLVNKMDLVDYDNGVFSAIREQYSAFLERLGVSPDVFIPVSGREGDNIAEHSERMSWYDGPTVLDQVDCFIDDDVDNSRPLRMPVQDIYKFTAAGDDRRIIAGLIETGTLRVGDEVVFAPSGKRSQVKSLELFNAPTPDHFHAGQSAGFTMTTQIYVQPGELLYRADQTPPQVATRFRANLFWMGRKPMVPGTRYRLKLGAARVPVELVRIEQVLDASELMTVADKQQADRHDVAEVILETLRPVAFDLAGELEKSSRFVVIDDYDISACGTILAVEQSTESLLSQRVKEREFHWRQGGVSATERQAVYRHAGKCIVFTAAHGDEQATALSRDLALRLERRLFERNLHTYYLAIGNLFADLERPEAADRPSREEHLLQLGELTRLMTDAGLLVVIDLAEADAYELEQLRLLNEPNELFVVDVADGDLGSFAPSLRLATDDDPDAAVEQIASALLSQSIVHDWVI